MIGFARDTGSIATPIGQACARNPLALIIPCHRMIGAGGQLRCYSAGAGATTKGWLLDFEARRTRLF